MKLNEIIGVLEEIAPPRYAVSGDKIGLQVGNREADVDKVIVTVDITADVVEEAVRRSAKLVVSHHPLIYEPLASVQADVYPQSLVYTMVQEGISLYVMHTNYDAAIGGVNDALAARLGVVDTQVLEPTYAPGLFKLVTFVPPEALDAVRSALAEAGVGVIGEYLECSFESAGTGTFRPMASAKPYIGEVGELQRVPELRLEMLALEGQLENAVSAMKAVHPYEEVAYDVYPLWGKGPAVGLGRYGRLGNPMTLDGFTEMVRDVLEVEEIRVLGNPEAKVEKVALLGGGGGGRIDLAYSKEVDVYVTGDVNHHQMLKAKALGLNVVDATHFWTERPGMLELAARLDGLLSDTGVAVQYVDDVTLGGR